MKIEKITPGLEVEVLGDRGNVLGQGKVISVDHDDTSVQVKFSPIPDWALHDMWHCMPVHVRPLKRKLYYVYETNVTAAELHDEDENEMYSSEEYAEVLTDRDTSRRFYDEILGRRVKVIVVPLERQTVTTPPSGPSTGRWTVSLEGNATATTNIIEPIEPLEAVDESVDVWDVDLTDTDFEDVREVDLY